MTTQQMKIRVAIEVVGFDYFTSCINNGATAEQARAEMMMPHVQSEIARRIQLCIK
jgi:hypothetical protein